MKLTKKNKKYLALAGGAIGSATLFALLSGAFKKRDYSALSVNTNTNNNLSSQTNKPISQASVSTISSYVFSADVQKVQNWIISSSGNSQAKNSIINSGGADGKLGNGTKTALSLLGLTYEQAFSRANGSSVSAISVATASATSSATTNTISNSLGSRYPAVEAIRNGGRYVGWLCENTTMACSTEYLVSWANAINRGEPTFTSSGSIYNTETGG